MSFAFAQGWKDPIQNAHGLELHIIEREDIIIEMMMPENASLCASFLHLAIDAEPQIADLISRVKRAADAVARTKTYCIWANIASSLLDPETSADAPANPPAIITQGISGWDKEFLEAMVQEGCYELFDGVTFHHARNNSTADADEQDVKDNFTYYGTVKHYMDFVRANDAKPAYATEVYAGT